MSNEMSLSDKELELATSRRVPLECTLADDATAARESFVALGSALEAAGPMLEEQVLVQRIVERLNSLSAADVSRADISIYQGASASPPVQRADRSAGWRQFLVLVVSGALAAAAGFVMFRATVSTVTQEAGQQKVAVAKAPVISVPESVQRPGAVFEAETFPTVEPSALAWDDPLDDEIAMAAAVMNRMSASSRDVDGSLYDMGEVLSALSAELAGESL